MARPTIKADNPDGFADMLRSMGTAFSESTIRKAAAAAATVVLKEAQRRAPVGPRNHHEGSKQYPVGFGRDQLLVAYAQERSAPGVVADYVVTWGRDAYYLRWYEYGRSNQAAQPFFRPAILATKLAQDYAVREQFDKALMEAGVSGEQ
jgi:HK97 gp10 family phage protein